MTLPKMKGTAIHLHWGWNDAAANRRDPLHTISIGIGCCGAQNLPRGFFVNDLEAVTCQACLEKAKEKPKPQPTPPPPPAPSVVAAKAKASTANGKGVIMVLVPRNPRKPGTGKYERMALLLKHNGKTVEEFVEAEGNLETLKNAIKEQIVEVK
jgi:hypothetical protein